MIEPRLSIAIMACPPRASRAAALAAALRVQAEAFSVFGPVVCMDHAMRGSRRAAADAWEIADTRATHHLVIQDDAIPSRDFIAGTLNVLRALPTHIIALHLPEQVAAKARGVAPVFVSTPVVIGAQALVMPVGRAVDAATYLRSAAGAYDDRALEWWLAARGERIHYVAPGLVEHDSTEPSTLAHTEAGAVRTAPRAASALDFDWLAAPCVSGGMI